MSDTDDDVDSGELLVTKWLMLGGCLWDASPYIGQVDGRKWRWFAIEPGHDENSRCRSASGRTPVHAIKNFIANEDVEMFPWLAPLRELVQSTTPSAPTPTPPHTAR